MSTFIYSNLLDGPNMTRMVQLLPHTNKNAPIECNLINYDLSEGGGRAHVYVALSYCWESNVRSETVTMNGDSFLVTKSLHTALLYLRDRQLGRVLWVDAICINQDDTSEKSRQIPLMRSIYAQADQVVVWLGEGREEGDKALEDIRYLSGQDRNPIKSFITEHRDRCMKLLRRNWFYRIWVRTLYTIIVYIANCSI